MAADIRLGLGDLNRSVLLVLISSTLLTGGEKQAATQPIEMT